MNRIFTLSLFTVLFWALAANAAEKSRIELTDGSLITGEVMKMSGGAYRIKTDSMGEVKIPSNRIKSIMSGSSSSHSSSQPAQKNNSASPNNAQIESIQKDIVSDPKMIELIQALMSEPELQSALNDPAMMEKINRGDTTALENDPSFQKFMNHPKVKEIMERAKSKN